MKDLQASKDAMRAKRARQSEDFRWLISDVRGRRFVYGLLKESRVLEPTYDPASVREVTVDMAYQEGRKVCGYKLLKRILAEAPDSLMRMIKENEDA